MTSNAAAREVHARDAVGLLVRQYRDLLIAAAAATDTRVRDALLMRAHAVRVGTDMLCEAATAMPRPNWEGAEASIAAIRRHLDPTQSPTVDGFASWLRNLPDEEPPDGSLILVEGIRGDEQVWLRRDLPDLTQAGGCWWRVGYIGDLDGYRLPVPASHGPHCYAEVLGHDQPPADRRPRTVEVLHTTADVLDMIHAYRTVVTGAPPRAVQPEAQR